EHAGGGLPELGGDLARDAHSRDVAATVLARQMAAHPARAGVGGEAQRIGGLPDGPRLIVGQVVVGIAAALDDGDLSQVVELLQGRESGGGGGVEGGPRVVADGGGAGADGAAVGLSLR